MYAERECFDAVIIVTPHKQHPAMVIRAFEAGKDVLCDKPAGATAKDAEAMNEAAARSGKLYAMVCHQRTYAQHIKVKTLLADLYPDYKSGLLNKDQYLINKQKYEQEQARLEAKKTAQPDPVVPGKKHRKKKRRK